MGSFQQYYQVGPLHEYSSGTIAWIPSLQIFFLFALGPVVGIIFDKYGPRPLIIGGTFLHVFGLMMASLAQTYYQFILSQGVCSAIGVACLYSPGKLGRSFQGIQRLVWGRLCANIFYNVKPWLAFRLGFQRDVALPWE